MSTAEKNADAKTKKMDYMKKLIGLMEEYPRLVLVTCDNIGSNHMQRIRGGLRGRGILLMGKNTLMRKAIRLSKETHPEWQDLLPQIWGNIGIVFTKEELHAIQPKLLESRVPAMLKLESSPLKMSSSLLKSPPSNQPKPIFLLPSILPPRLPVVASKFWLMLNCVLKERKLEVLKPLCCKC